MKASLVLHGVITKNGKLFIDSDPGMAFDAADRSGSSIARSFTFTVTMIVPTENLGTVLIPETGDAVMEVTP